MDADNGACTASTSGCNDWLYTYNEAGWLTKADNPIPGRDEEYTYADNGNMLTRKVGGVLKHTFAYPAASSAHPHGPSSLKVGTGTAAGLWYDPNGNMVSDTAYGGGSRALSWDGANRLAKASVMSAEGMPQRAVAFAYGPDGERAVKSGDAAAPITTFYPSNDVEIEVERGLDRVTRYPHMDVKVVDGEKFWLHRDNLSSVRIVTDESGAKVDGVSYAPYGEVLSSGGTTSKGYIGERYDSEVGLLYLHARYCDPSWGRCISPDDCESRPGAACVPICNTPLANRAATLKVAIQLSP